MTLHATRDGQHITVHHTSGPSQVHVTEDVQHTRVFHRQLGELLDEAEAEREKPAPEEHHEHR